jgi:hypothetical protein
VRQTSEQAIAEGRYVEVFNAATNDRLRFVRWYDLDESTACCFKRDPASPWGQAMQAANVPADAISVVIRCPLRVTERVVARPMPFGKPEPLPEELTRLSVSYERYVAERGRDAETCEYPRCHNRAVYVVRSLMDGPPLFLGTGQPFRRTVVVKIAKYCHLAQHYRCPTRIDARGNESEISVTVARPQWGGK